MTTALIRGLARTSCLLVDSRPTVTIRAQVFYSLDKKPINQPLEPSDEKPKVAKYSRQAVRENVNEYVFGRYIDYVKNYDKVLEKNFPSAVHVYRVFFEGVKDFLSDMKRYLKITRIANDSPNGLKALTRKELELYLRMPKDMVKVAPALLFTALPVVGNAVFAIAFMFPRALLTSHFWSLQQKSEFQQLYLKERLCSNRKVLRHLQAKLDTVKTHPLGDKWKDILGLLGSGQHPTTDEILRIKDIFVCPPYDYQSLSSNHIKYLCQIHGIRGGPFKKSRLLEQAFVIHYMDLGIQREGEVHNMPQDALKYACYLRGLNPSNLSNDDMIQWLRLWVKVSLAIQMEHISLFLHLPILIGYNHPNNWILIH